ELHALHADGPGSFGAAHVPADARWPAARHRRVAALNAPTISVKQQPIEVLMIQLGRFATCMCIPSLLALLVLLGGCATRPINPPITQVDPSKGYRLETRQAYAK